MEFRIWLVLTERDTISRRFLFPPRPKRRRRRQCRGHHRRRCPSSWHFDRHRLGYGCIDVKVWTNQVRWQFLALYLVRRTNFWVSCLQKILFAYIKDTSIGSLDREPVSWFWFADPHFVYRCIPWLRLISPSSQIFFLPWSRFCRFCPCRERGRCGCFRGGWPRGTRSTTVEITLKQDRDGDI